MRPGITARQILSGVVLSSARRVAQFCLAAFLLMFAWTAGPAFAQEPAPPAPAAPAAASSGDEKDSQKATPAAAAAATSPGLPPPAPAPTGDMPPVSSSELPGATMNGAPGDASNVRFTVTQSDAPIERVTGDLSKKSGKTVVARGKTVGQRITVILKDQPLERHLDYVTSQKPNWLWYKPDESPNTYEIWDQESFKVEVLPKNVRQKVFVPREITAEEAFKAVQGVLTPNIGSASFDPRSNKLIVTDLPFVLELIQRLLDQIDVKFITRVFYIQHADINAIAEKISNLKSPAAPAPDVDERTRQIIVRDRLEIIRQMELLVQTLDIGPELREYDLNNLGFEGEGRADIEDAIQDILTPNAYFKINVQAGKMLVQDVPEVHEKIEKILAAFDQPPKQVLLEAEIIETRFQEGFNWSIDYTFSQDLFASVLDGLTGDSVPQGNQTPATDQNLGFINFQDEFPIVQAGASGVTASWLSKQAYIALKTAMTDSRTRILQQPRELVLNQKEAIFRVGQRLAYFTSSGYYNNNNGNNNNNYNTYGQLQFAQVGLEISIRPTINNNGTVQMDILLVNNSGTIVNRVYNGQNNDVPDIRNQEIETTLLVPSGQTRVIGGLITELKSESRSGVPGLVKIPYLGPALFGKYDRPEDSNGRRNLLIFITPTIQLENPGDLLKYKGKILTNGDDASDQGDFLTTPSATLSDTQLDPIPVPVITPSVPQYPKSGESRSETEVLQKAMVPGEPIPEETPAAGKTEEDPSGLTDLKRVEIKDAVVTTGPLSYGKRMVGPKGALTGESAGTGGPGGRSPAATPGIFTPTTAIAPVAAPPAPSVPAVAPVAAPVTTPVATPAPTPARETKI
ncbi:MAG: hypothetical protein K1X53_10370 [Candidatus Sumerlaeaceae bacterium]|nr:hypothetical protein [Candidatus Sumerlaeaceae bacterium]